MLTIHEVLKKHNIVPNRYIKKNNVVYIEDNNKKYVIKRNNNNSIYKYLDARNFNYYPLIYTEEDEDYQVQEYLEEYDLPKEQKLEEMINLLGLLHNKTTFYKNIDIADNKKIYEEITSQINELFKYYDIIMINIENKIIYSPSEYYLARNISKIFESLTNAKNKIDDWYKNVENNTKARYVVNHNNVSLDHFIRNEQSYFISWDKAKIDMPIYDLYNLFKKNDYNYQVILEEYEKRYPLLDYEKKLLTIMLMMPDKLELTNNEYEMTKKITHLIDNLYKIDFLDSIAS